MSVPLVVIVITALESSELQDRPGDTLSETGRTDPTPDI
jgi:hypothetical protein